MIKGMRHHDQRKGIGGINAGKSRPEELPKWYMPSLVGVNKDEAESTKNKLTPV
jgi:hypothetical protein